MSRSSATWVHISFWKNVLFCFVLFLPICSQRLPKYNSSDMPPRQQGVWETLRLNSQNQAGFVLCHLRPYPNSWFPHPWILWFSLYPPTWNPILIRMPAGHVHQQPQDHLFWQFKACIKRLGTKMELIH